jgi:lipopolysaccharide export system protein LptA
MYNTETEVSYFYGPTKIISKENNIYCENGWYDTRNDIAQFNKNAFYNNKEQTMSGDSLYYDRTNGIGKAFNNIVLTDTVQKIIINGDNAYYNEKKGKILITEKACLAKIMDKDTFFLHADTLRAYFDSSHTEKTLLAYNKAKFYKSDMQGISDSLVYTFKDSTITLYKKPVLWTQENQLTADTISIVIGKEKIRRMYLYNSSFIVSMDDTLQAKLKSIDSIRFNQIKGRNMIGYFENNELKKITVIGNGETIYFVRGDDGAMIGVNKAESAKMNIYVDNNAINKIVFISSPTATLYPEKDLAPKDLVLRDIKWYKDKRPANKHDIFNW